MTSNGTRQSCIVQHFRRRAVGCLIAIAMLVSASAGANRNTAGKTSSTDRYVAPSGHDSDRGSRERPWKSIQHAAEMAFPGMTVHVAPGVYTGPITTNASGAPPARIRFISDTKWGAAIQSSGGADVWTNRGSYIDIAGFDVRGDGANGILNWGSQVRIIGNHVHNIPAPHCTGNGGAGIFNAGYQEADNDVIGNVVHDIGEGPGSCGRVHGIYHANLRGHIYNNVVYRSAGYGIHLWHAASNVVIANNTVVGNGGGDPARCTGGGIVVGDGDSPGGKVNDYTLVVNNIIYHNGCVGIVEYCYKGQECTGPHNQYRNNLVFENASRQLLLRNGLNGAQTVSADPQLLNVQQNAVVDFHLRPGSPAIDHGTDFQAPTMDIDGGRRPDGAAWDIGASEFRSSPANWPWF